MSPIFEPNKGRSSAATPSNLGERIQLSSPQLWIGLLGVLLVISTLTLWAIYGQATTRVQGTGLVVRQGGILNVTSQAGGIVTTLNVKTGDLIHAHQIIGTISQPVLAQQIRTLRSQLTEALADEQRKSKLRTSNSRLDLLTLKRKLENNRDRSRELAEQKVSEQRRSESEEQLLSKGLVTQTQVEEQRLRITLIVDQMSTLEAQNRELEAESYRAETIPEAAALDDVAKVQTLRAALANLETELSLSSNVISSFDGQVLEVKTSPGGLVGAGEPILSVQPRENALELIAYVPSSAAKDIHKEMQVEVSPSNIKREEYGYMRGVVEDVASYPATPDALKHNFQNTALTSALSGAGLVTELRIHLLRDAAATGFEWSSRRTPPAAVSSGTICGINVITRRQHPINLLFPGLRRDLHS